MLVVHDQFDILEIESALNFCYHIYCCCVDLPFHVLFSSSSSLKFPLLLMLPLDLICRGFWIVSLSKGSILGVVLLVLGVVVARNDVNRPQKIVRGVSNSQNKYMNPCSEPTEFVIEVDFGRTNMVPDGAKPKSFKSKSMGFSSNMLLGNVT